MRPDAVHVFADNVRRLIAEGGEKQEAVAKRSGVSQRAISDLVNYGKSMRKSPTVRTVEGISKAFGIEVWMMFVPDLPIQLLRGEHVAKLIKNYRDATDEGRSAVDRVAESEVRYALAHR